MKANVGLGLLWEERDGPTGLKSSGIPHVMFNRKILKWVFFSEKTVHFQFLWI